MREPCGPKLKQVSPGLLELEKDAYVTNEAYEQLAAFLDGRDAAGSLIDLTRLTDVSLGLELSRQVLNFLDSRWFYHVRREHAIESTEIDIAYLKRLATEIEERECKRKEK